MHACEKEKEKEDGLLIFGDRSRGNLGNEKTMSAPRWRVAD